jgi:hypothetical protein
MPTLSVTGIRQPRENLSTHKVQFVTVTGPASYSAGGDSFAPSDFGWSTFDHVSCELAWSGTAARLVVYDYTNSKLVWYVPNTGSEASGDLSTYSLRVMVVGHG